MQGIRPSRVYYTGQLKFNRFPCVALSYTIYFDFGKEVEK